MAMSARVRNGFIENEDRKSMAGFNEEQGQTLPVSPWQVARRNAIFGKFRRFCSQPRPTFGPAPAPYSQVARFFTATAASIFPYLVSYVLSNHKMWEKQPFDLVPESAAMV